MKKTMFAIVFSIAVFAALICSCASSGGSAASGKKNQNTAANSTARSGVQIRVKEKRDTFDLIEVPYQDFGYAWNYKTYVRPNYPSGVAKNVYETIWNYYVKTIERGDYDYDSYNRRNEGDPNWVTPIGEFRDDPSFRFHGVCFQYADYFEFLMKKDPTLKPLIDSGILRFETAPSHKYWVYQEPNGVKYFIDPTWGDWTVYGTPKGQFAYNLEHERIVERSSVRYLLVEAEMRSWFFIQANAIGADRTDASTRNSDRSAHNLEERR